MSVGPSRTTLRVLLVDDDPDQYVLTKDLLEISASGHLLEWAPSFEAAATRMKPGAYDVALVDYRLGARNGLELLRLPSVRQSGIPASCADRRGRLARGSRGDECGGRRVSREERRLAGAARALAAVRRGAESSGCASETPRSRSGGERVGVPRHIRMRRRSASHTQLSTAGGCG